MPLVIIHTSAKEQTDQLQHHLPKIKTLCAKKLSCGDRDLNDSEISIRVIESSESAPIAAIEIMITAFSYKERVEQQDKICLEIKLAILEMLPEADLFVWLQLSELGHSVEE